MTTPKTPEERATFFRANLIARARAVHAQTPAWWDRDCRCCMTPGNNFQLRAVKGVQPIISIGGEEIHAEHTDEEINRFLDAPRGGQIATV